MNDEAAVEREAEAAASAADRSAAWSVLNAASRGKADAFLDEQIVVARAQAEVLHLQAHELKHELKLRHWSLRMRHASDVLKVTFEITAALIALGIFAIIAAAIWSAAHDDTAVIEAFRVPPDMAERGLSGDVVASQLLDRLADLQANTQSVRAPGTYVSNFGTDIKVEIPDTGVSIGEAYRYLAGWLGRRTHISGEVFRSGTGFVLAVRASGHPGAHFAGSENNLDVLVQRAAEYIYGQTQPFRYGAWLLNQNRFGEADSVLGNLAENGPLSERPWAYADWMYTAIARGDIADTLARAREAAKLGPEIALAQNNAMIAEATAGHDEQILRYAAATKAAFAGGARRELIESAAVLMEQEAAAAADEELGDFGAALAQYDVLLGAPEFSGSHWQSDYMKSADAAKMHDVSASRRDLGTYSDAQLLHLGSLGAGWQLVNVDFPQFKQYAVRDDWKAARADLARALATPDARYGFYQISLRTQMLPWLALAEAKSGDLRSAAMLIAKTPLDCYLCLRVRGQIEAARHNPAGAARWFSRAAAQAQSVPFAWTDWGKMLLHKGDYDGAIAKFTSAHMKGPRFADPLEMWGEALMQKSRSDLALAKFEEANKYAPNWGRLHLEWGKALYYLGRRAEARQQFATASKLDLSGPDAAALSHWRARHV